MQQQGINSIDWAISTNILKDNNGWIEILAQMPVKSFYSIGEDKKIRSLNSGSYKVLVAGEKVVAGSTQIELTDDRIPLWQLQIQNQKWLLVGNTQLSNKKIQVTSQNIPSVQVLMFAKNLDADLVAAIKPEVAIAYAQKTDSKTTGLAKIKTKIFLTASEGAIQWTPSNKFEPTIETIENNASLL